MTIKKKRDEDLDYEDEITEYHRLPDTDFKGHDADPDCWCKPRCTYKNPETGNEIWTHNLIQ